MIYEQHRIAHYQATLYFNSWVVILAQDNLLIPLILCIGGGRALLALRATPPLY